MLHLVSQLVIPTRSDVMDCSHEQADTTINVHILLALHQDVKSIKVCTVDTDVIVILNGAFFELSQTNL